MTIHGDDVQDFPILTGQVHPARQYLRELPGVLGAIGAELRGARMMARDLLPFVWRTTADEERDATGMEWYDLGRNSEPHKGPDTTD